MESLHEELPQTDTMPEVPTIGGIPVSLRAYNSELDRRAQRQELEKAQNETEQTRAECQSLKEFVKKAWVVLEPRAKLIWGWHMDAICDHLEAVSRGQINRLCINVPPGSSKSLLVSVLWPAWEWGPLGMHSLRYLSTSFNDRPVKRDTRKTRNLILSEWYQTLWPEVKLTRHGETSFENSGTGTREGVAFGSLTSQRGDRLIIDDPHSTETAESETERNNTTRKFREGALDRLNDQEESAIVVIMQRLHQDDVTGVIETLPELGFVMLIIPMRFEPDRACQTSLPWKDPRKKIDQLMDPNRFPADVCDRLEIGKGDYAWAGQYQQRPAPREGGLFKVDNLEIVSHAPEGGRAVRGWDIAGSTRKTSPFTVGVKMKEVDGEVYVLDVKRARAKILAAERLLTSTAREDTVRCKQSIPQDPGSAGLSQKAHLSKKLAGLSFKFSTEKGEKDDRAIPFASQVEAGMVKLVKAPWNQAYIDELRNFPAGSFKDQVDASSRAYEELITSRVDAVGGAPVAIPLDEDDDEYVE